jgi:hypothetical protein
MYVILFLGELSDHPVFHFGLSDITKILDTAAFVDKTLTLKEILKKDFVFITAPRMFDKSTNLMWLSIFFFLATDYRLGFNSLPSPALGPTQPPLQWVPGVKRPGA